MRTFLRLILLTLAGVLAGCLETMPRIPSIDDLPQSPTLRDRNAAIAQSWDQASLDCRAQHKPRGSFCEQLRTEGDFLFCSSERFAKTAQALRYPLPDKIWVWHNCVKTTANQLRDGYYLSRQEIDRRMTACQAKLDPEPEFPVRKSGWFAPILGMVWTDEKESVQAVLPGDFGMNQSQVALPSCAARFSTQLSTNQEMKPVAVAAPVLPPQVAPSEPVLAPVAEEVTRDTARRRPRQQNSVSTTAVKPTSSSSSGRSGAGSSAASLTPAMKGACPIPGACGPTVPPDAVKRPE
ncbi:MAG: hypothetical protein EB072_00690 [Betaproteobacteria bacterium]|nr:hypothetical protein [Betaproteobacteria bacterium]